MNLELPVLDHGFVRLVDSMPHWDSGVCGDDRIAAAARVSYAGGTKKVRSNEGLIRYLVRNFHSTPLEQVKFTFHVKLPISVARQWARHRSGSYSSFNEISTRYSEVEDEIYIPELSRMGVQDKKNRQGTGDPLSEDKALQCQAIMCRSTQVAYDAYQSLLEIGLARETARGVLPLDTYTAWYWSIDLWNLMHFLKLRLDTHAQFEIREYAQAVLTLARPIAPIAFEAWEVSLSALLSTPPNPYVR